MMKITQNEVIDPTFRGNQARFINHSCDPNCITQKWNVLGETVVGVFAIKDIREGSELSFDYQFDSFKTPLTKCLCGAYNCKGYLGKKPQEYSLEEWEERLENLPCSICGQNVEDDDDKLLLCDLCHEGFHIFCLDPPLTEIPEGSWFCDKCMVKLEQEEKLKRDFNPLEMNTKLYEIVKKERSKLHVYDKKGLVYSEEVSEEEEEEEEEESEEEREYQDEEEVEKSLKKVVIKNTEEMKTIKSRIKKKKKKFIDSYPGSEEEEVDDVRIKRKVKKVEPEKMVTEETEDKEKTGETKEEIEAEEAKKTERKPRGLRTDGSLVMEFKEKALAMFQEGIKEKGLMEKIEEIERRNYRGLLNIYGGNENMDKKTKMINSIQLDVAKKNQVIFRRIGTRLFWEHHKVARVNVFRKTIEMTVMGYKGQLEVIELVFQVLDDIAEEIERMRGQKEAKMRIPAMYLRKITGTYHNQHM